MSKAVLTIDDVASANTPAIVDYLCEKKIPVILFAVGEKVKQYYDEAIYALKKGILIGNHSYSHPAFSSLSLEEGIAEIERNEEVLNRLYKDAGVERRFRPFRFPYGDKGGENKDALQKYFKENGFDKVADEQITGSWYTGQNQHQDVDTLWTFDFGEWQIREGEDFTAVDVLKRMHEQHPGYGEALFEEGSHHILLLHAHDETEAMEPEYYKLFLEEALRGGVEFEAPRFVRL
ncbi:MAG: polysaccharide deacetylase family protein [Lachnospiraceae bacterium]|nr:polysaccharide deacetylase family protein [Lachnospiraceae bacterium]